MASAKDITNQKFGELVALHQTEKRSHNRTVIWVCKCLACGKEVEYPSTKLRAGEVRSCGCLEHVKTARTLPGESGFNKLVHEYKYGAKIRNLEFELTKKQIKEIVTQNCFYCGAEPSKITYGSLGAKREYGKFISNGIDRLNNDLGYLPDNVVPCCGRCNIAKGTMSADEFLHWIETVYKFTRF